jgi:sporulation protein YlmC with PRC-barrel domain
MRVSDLLETTVVDTNGRVLGRVRDVRIVQDGPLHASGQAGFRVHGLVAGRFAFGTRLGYVTRPGITPTAETRGPLPLRALFRWLHRKANYIPWENITRIADDRITVRPDRTR